METLVQIGKEIGLVTFTSVFALVFFYTFRKGNQQLFSNAATLPFEDDYSSNEVEATNNEEHGNG